MLYRLFSMMNKEEIIEAIKDRKTYEHLLKNYPLAVSRLWVPYCYNWNLSPDRKVECRIPMIQIKDDYYRCSSCGIEEKRTSQKRAADLFGRYSESFCLLGGNRSGKTEIGAQLLCAIVLGRNSWMVRAWLQLNDLDDSIVPNEEPSTAIA